MDLNFRSIKTIQNYKLLHLVLKNFKIFKANNSTVKNTVYSNIMPKNLINYLYSDNNVIYLL